MLNPHWATCGFSWKVPELIQGADMALREADDRPVRIVLAFDGVLIQTVSRIWHCPSWPDALTGEELPTPRDDAGAIPGRQRDFNPRTDRIPNWWCRSRPAH